MAMFFSAGVKCMSVFWSHQIVFVSRPTGQDQSVVSTVVHLTHHLTNAFLLSTRTKCSATGTNANLMLASSIVM